MRKIEQQMVAAVMAGKNFRKSNTEVKSHGAYSEVYLFGSHIATYHRVHGYLWINACGWTTRTTKSRLNALGARINQWAGTWYVKGFGSWSGRTTIVISGDAVFLDDFPEMLTAEEQHERARLKLIEQQKNSHSAEIRRRRRKQNREDTWWNNIFFE